MFISRALRKVKMDNKTMARSWVIHYQKILPVSRCNIEVANKMKPCSKNTRIKTKARTTNEGYLGPDGLVNRDFIAIKLGQYHGVNETSDYQSFS